MMDYFSADIGKAIVTALTGKITCHPVMAKSGATAPYLVYNTLSNEPDDWKDSAHPVDVVPVLLSVYHSTYLGLSIKVKEIRKALDGYSNSAYHLDSTVFVTEMDEYDDDNQLFVKNMEFKFRINNS